LITASNLRLIIEDGRSRISAIRDVITDKIKARHGLQFPQAILLHARVIGIVQVIHTNDGMPSLDQNFEVRAPMKPAAPVIK